ncbi:hypothetical protein [Planktotalea sp.]
MKHLVSLLVMAAFLASCGADGMPTKPEPKSDKAEEAPPVSAAAAS